MIAPVLLIVILLAIGAGRVSRGNTSVDQAAYAAARAASIARTPGEARAGAQAAAKASLGEQGLTCPGGLSTAVDVSGFSQPVGTPASVRVSITCRVTLQDLDVPGLGSGRTLTATATSPIDTFRERG